MRTVAQLGPAALSLVLLISACKSERAAPLDSSSSTQGGSIQAESFDALVEEMDQSYSYFALNGIDWDDITQRHRASVRAANDADAFVSAIVPMLSELEDIHVWVEKSSGEVVATDELDATMVDYGPISSRLTDIVQIGKVAFTGRTSKGNGFVAIGSLQMSEAEASSLESAIEALFDASGIVVDIRNNAGGDELLGRRIASMFADTTRTYAYARVRNGPSHDDFGPAEPRSLEPRSGTRFNGPVVLVTGARTMSSAEGLTLMFRTMPHVTVIGQTTRGASGNPGAKKLPNGVSVYFSRWLALDENKKPFERVGLVPSVVVKDGQDVLDIAEQELVNGRRK